MKKVIIPIIAVFVAAGVFTVYYLDDKSIQPQTLQEEPLWTKTDPSYHGTENWIGSIGASYTATNPFELKEESDLIVEGKILDIEFKEFSSDSDPNDGVVEPPLRVITYTILVNEIVKGQHDDTKIKVTTYVDPKIDYKIDDSIFFILGYEDGQYFTKAGPNGMFKIDGDNLVSDEKTIKSIHIKGN